MGNRYHYCFVAQVVFKESIQSHPEGMAIDIYPQENFWAVAPGGCKHLSFREKEDFRHCSAYCSLLATSSRLTDQPFTHLDTALGKVTPTLCREVSLVQPYRFSCRAHVTNIKCCNSEPSLKFPFGL